LDSSSGQARDAGLVELGDSLKAQADGGKPSEIKKASTARQEKLDLLDTKIHPRRELRMQSSRTARDSSSTQP
jgi:hypothetical protein